MEIIIFKNIAFQALRKSYSENQILRLSFDGNVKRLTEYFITVNLCQQLLEWNSENHYQYKIEAEKKTFDFYNSCFESNKIEIIANSFPEMYYVSDQEEFLKNISIIRKGRIDITLSREINDRNISESLIEVKSINPNLTKIKDDFNRIQQYLNSSITNFENLLKNGFIVFIKHINNINKIQKKENLKKEKELYITNLKKRLSLITENNIEFDIYTDYIENSPYENLQMNYNDDDFSRIAYDTFSAFSVIIEVKRV